MSLQVKTNTAKYGASEHLIQVFVNVSGDSNNRHMPGLKINDYKYVRSELKDLLCTWRLNVDG